MEEIKKRFLIFLNFLDLGMGMEKVWSPNLRATNFALFLRSSEVILYFFINYAIVKFIQFVIALLVSVSMKEVPIGFFVVPLLLLLELGSKHPFNDIKGIVLLLTRIALKFSIFYCIDCLIA